MKCQRCGKPADKLTDKLCNGKDGFRKRKVCDKCLKELEDKK